MATAGLISDASVSITGTATPLAGDFIPGSTQEFGRTVTSQGSQTPVFFAPCHNREELMASWGNLLHGMLRGFYTFVPAPGPYAISAGRTFGWDRLSLELMRIASLGQNWDGEGAEAVTQKAVQSTSEMLSLAKAVMDRSVSMFYSVPTLLPDVEGGITLKWIHESKELKCTVLGEIVEVVRWRSSDRFEADGLWEVPVFGVVEHFEWLLRH